MSKRESPQPSYTYIFEDIADASQPGTVKVIKHHAQKQACMSIAVKDGQFLKRHLHYMSAPLADCVDVATGVYTADGLSAYYGHARTSIHVVLPLRNPELWQADAVRTQLETTLNWFTHHIWTFQFVQRKSLGRLPELQSSLPFSNEPVEVNLWSGGLDALVGLLNRWVTDPLTKHILFGSGGNFFIEGVQKTLATSLETRLAGVGEVELVQIPLRLRNVGERITRNSSQRSRGLVFMLLGAVCARLYGQNTLFLYENGTGAINLPFNPSQFGRSQTVSVHPVSLLRMSRLISAVLGEDFSIINPFLTWTKAEMCEVLKRLGADDLVTRTVTCDSRRRGPTMQCGCCSSCLLRRQALITAGVRDDTRYGVLESLRPGLLSSHQWLESSVQGAVGQLIAEGAEPSFRPNHLRAMLRQVEALKPKLASDDPWYELVHEWSGLRKIVDEPRTLGIPAPITERQILNLYQRYVDEWSNPIVLDDLQQGLVRQASLAPSTRPKSYVAA